MQELCEIEKILLSDQRQLPARTGSKYIPDSLKSLLNRRAEVKSVLIYLICHMKRHILFKFSFQTRQSEANFKFHIMETHICKYICFYNTFILF